MISDAIQTLQTRICNRFSTYSNWFDLSKSAEYGIFMLKFFNNRVSNLVSGLRKPAGKL